MSASSRTKKVPVEIILNIHSLVDIPLIYGQLYFKYKVSGSSFYSQQQQQHPIPEGVTVEASTDQTSGKSRVCDIRNHAATWDHAIRVYHSIYPQEEHAHVVHGEAPKITIKIKKEVRSGRAETLGQVEIDLADFLFRHPSLDRQTGRNRKWMNGQYLLKQSKMNSALKVNAWLHFPLDAVAAAAKSIGQPTLSHHQNMEQPTLVAGLRVNGTTGRPMKPPLTKQNSVADPGKNPFLMSTTQQQSMPYELLNPDAVALVDGIFAELEHELTGGLSDTDKRRVSSHAQPLKN